MFHFHNGVCLAFMFSLFPMTLFLLPTKRRNKIRVKKGKFFDECVGMFSSFVMTLFLLQTERRNKIRVRKSKFFDECVGSVSANVSVVCRWCVDQRVYRRVGGIGFFTFTSILELH